MSSVVTPKLGLAYDPDWKDPTNPNWPILDNAIVADFVGSGPGHSNGAVPDPGAAAGTTKFLREDAAWAVPPATGLTQAQVLSRVSIRV